MKRIALLLILSFVLSAGALFGAAAVGVDAEPVRAADALMNDGTGTMDPVVRKDCLYCRGEDECIKVELGYDDCPWIVLGGRHLCQNPANKPCTTGGSTDLFLGIKMY